MPKKRKTAKAETLPSLVKQGYLTERQSTKLRADYAMTLGLRNKARDHKPRRIPDAEWAKVKAEYQASTKAKLEKLAAKKKGAKKEK